MYVCMCVCVCVCVCVSSVKVLFLYLLYNVLAQVLADMKSNGKSQEVNPLVKMPERWECPRFKIQCSCGRPFSSTERRVSC